MVNHKASYRENTTLYKPSRSKEKLEAFFHTIRFSLRRDCQKLPMPTIFQVVMAGYWEKFSISNNRASDKPHWLRYCHCAKLENVSTHPLPPWLTTPFSLRVSDHQRVRGLGAFTLQAVTFKAHPRGGLLMVGPSLVEPCHFGNKSAFAGDAGECYAN